MDKKSILATLLVLLVFSSHYPANSFTRVSDLLFEGEQIADTAKLTELREGMSSGRKFRIINGFQTKPGDIEIEIDSSNLLVKTSMDIQLPITSSDFFRAVQEAVDLWNDVDISTVMINPLIFSTRTVDAEDGRNVISGNVIEPIAEVTGGNGNSTTIVNYARSENIIFMGKRMMVKPGTILDTDLVYDPSNDPCLGLFTTFGDFKIGGEFADPHEGGADPILVETTCNFATNSGDITDIAVKGIGKLLGLDSSALSSSATARVGFTMERYALTNDDKIGLANIYPNKSKLKELGTIKGKITAGKGSQKDSVSGAHVVVEDLNTGEAIASAITDVFGKYQINALPAGKYIVFVEPVDGPMRRNNFFFNFFARNADLDFTTKVFPKTVTVKKRKKTTVNISVEESPETAFNINPQVGTPLTEPDVNAIGGHTSAPLEILPGQTRVAVLFWGNNIDANFGTLSVSGSGVRVENVANVTVPISPRVECAECEDPEDEDGDGIPDDPEARECNRDPRCPADQELTKEADNFPGIQADFICEDGAIPGPRNVIFTADKLDPENPNFGLRDQVSGGLIVREP